MSDNNGAIIRAAIYARVSTDDQAERGTIDAQVQALRQTVPRDQWDASVGEADRGLPHG